MVLVEAMACEVPVIASRCEWGPEEILEGGRYGLLYDPGDIRALAQHLESVLDDQAESLAGLLSAAGRRAERFSQETVLPEFVGHIEALLSR
jgi:glycosyltransferase involved in cell wall biosynthesis